MQLQETYAITFICAVLITIKRLHNAFSYKIPGDKPLELLFLSTREYNQKHIEVLV